MPLQKTYEELMASNISPRNYSAVLPVIYNLRKTANRNYVPEAVKTVVYSAGAVGDGAQKTFDTINASYDQGQNITLTGTATYVLSGGASPIIKPAINIVAQIDMNLQNVDKSLIPYQVYAKASEINSSGQFSFVIPSSITKLLSTGIHYVYIDASSPDNAPVRLVASSTSTDPNNKLYYTRSFNITPPSSNILIQGTAVPVFGSSAAAYNTTTDNAPYNAGWTLAISSTQDDSYFALNTLHNIYIYGTGYTTIYPGSNTYITAIGGSTNYGGLSFVNPALPAIQLGSSDNSWQRVWYKTESDKTKIRYEGTAYVSGTPGSPNIVYEVTFFKPIDSYQYIEIRFGVHNRTAGVFGIQNGGGSSVNGGTITPNQSYVIRTDNTGNNPVIFSGYYMSI